MVRFLALLMTFCFGWTSTSSLWGEGFPPPPVPSVMAWTAVTWSRTLGGGSCIRYRGRSNQGRGALRLVCASLRLA